MNPDSRTRIRPQRLKERLREVTSDAILTATQEVVLAEGLEAPMEHIAARAGVAVGTLYNHLKDRKALVEALLDRHREQLREDVRAAEQAHREEPVRAQLIAMLTAMSVGWSKIYLVMKQGEKVPDSKKRSEMRARFLQGFAGVLERGRKDGTLASDPDGLQPIALQGLIQAFFAAAADDPRKHAPEKMAERVVELFLHGAARKARG